MKFDFGSFNAAGAITSLIRKSQSTKLHKFFFIDFCWIELTIDAFEMRKIL